MWVQLYKIVLPSISHFVLAITIADAFTVVTSYSSRSHNQTRLTYGLTRSCNLCAGGVWPCRFHVDKVSSAHVYLRLKKGETIDTISEGLLEDCAQLVKAHSIQGAPPILAAFV